MRREIIAIRTTTTSNSDTSKITDVKLDTGQTYTVQQVVIDINLGNIYYYTTSRFTTAEIEVVNANPRYIRTKANHIAIDNLLSLPRF